MTTRAPAVLKTTNKASAFPNIGNHISEKELIRGEKVGIFYLGACEGTRSLQARILVPGG